VKITDVEVFMRLIRYIRPESLDSQFQEELSSEARAGTGRDYPGIGRNPN